MIDCCSFGDRLVIAHFFNPAHIVPLVELVQSEQTQAHIMPQLQELLAQCGKQAILLKRDIDGFIANRLQAAVLREAMYLLDEGIADAQDIDLAMTAGPGMRWAVNGPLQIADFGGLDIWTRVSDRLFPELNRVEEAPAWMREKVAQGQFGVKSGQGIYTYDDAEALKQAEQERERMFIHLLQQKQEQK